VDQFVVKNQILGAEQVADGRDVGRVTTDEGDRIVNPIGRGDGPFEFPVYRPFSGNQAARGDRGTVLVDGLPGRCGNLRVAGKREVVVACEVDVLASVDARRRPGDAIVELEKGAVDAQAMRAFADDANLLVAGCRSKR
jgi:hypothetical protein